MKLLALVCASVVSLGIVCARSFELMFVVDAGSKSIKRFDPINGLYLGQIGAGFFVNPKGIAYCSDNSLVVVDQITATRSVVRKFDADTGMVLGQRTLNSTGVLTGIDQAPDGKLYACEDTGPAATTARVWEFDLNLAAGPVLHQSSAPGGTFQARDIKFWSRTPGTSEGYVAGLGGVCYFNTLTNSMGPGFSTSQYAYTGEWFDPTANLNYLGFGSTTATTPPSFSSTFFTNCRDFIGGHEYLYAVGTTAAGSPVIGRYDTDARVGLSTFGSGTLIDPTYVAIHNAPEPGSMVALALGLAGIVAKRRRKQ